MNKEETGGFLTADNNGSVKKKAVTYILGVIASLCLIVALVVLSVEFNINDESFFINEYVKCRVDISLEMNMGDIEVVSKEMMKYLFGKWDDLVVYTTLGGTYREFFNDREKTHMIDVKAMYDTAIAVRTVCLIITAAVIVILAVMWKRRIFPYLARSYLIAWAVTAAFFAFIGIFIMACGFTEFWERFHGVFFTNDLWLLNPATDMMIRLLPEQFFSDLVARSVLVFGLVCGILFILSLVVLFRCKRQRNIV